MSRCLDLPTTMHWTYAAPVAGKGFGSLRGLLDLLAKSCRKAIGMWSGFTGITTAT